MKIRYILTVMLLCMTFAGADMVSLRQNSVLLNNFNNNPYPLGQARGDVVRAYSIFALASNGSSQVDSADIAEANTLLEGLYSSYPPADQDSELYWMMPHLSRILSDQELNIYLTTAAQESVKNVLSDYVTENDDIAYASLTEMWTIIGSENHDMLRKQVFLTTAEVFAENSWPISYNDGYSASDHYHAWGEYFSLYFTERAKKGINTEVGAPTYGGVLLESIFIIHDLSDGILKKRAAQYLDLYFADRALCSINGVRGGAKSRAYHNHYSSYPYADFAASYSWLLVGQPEQPYTLIESYNLVPALTSSYRLDAVVENLYDHDARGSYEYITTRPGKGTGTAEPIYSVTFPSDIRWYCWSDPNFIMGSFVIDENAAYTNISSQNRWNGLIAEDDLYSRIFFTPEIEGGSDSNTYNDFVANQYKGTMLIRKHKDADNNGFRMFVSDTFSISQDSGWVFGKNSDDDLYFGAYAVSGGVTIISASDYFTSWNWVTFDEPSTIVIFEAASSDKYASYTAFKNACKANSKGFSGSRYDYTSVYDSAVVSLFTDTSLPQVNGDAVTLNSAFTYHSPYLNASYDSAQITITDPQSNSLVLDFTEPYYRASDITADGYVNLEDMAEVAGHWGQDTDPLN